MAHEKTAEAFIDFIYEMEIAGFPRSPESEEMLTTIYNNVEDFNVCLEAYAKYLGVAITDDNKYLLREATMRVIDAVDQYNRMEG